MKKIKVFFHKLCRYGFSIAFWDLLDSLRKRIGFLPVKISENKHDAIVNWLAEKFNYFICDFKNQSSDPISLDDAIPPQIWVCWWDGIGMMPPIVRVCYNSLLKYADRYNVTLITKDNFFEYIEIPNHVLEKVKSGSITITHFSDIIRMSLLEKHGGLWLDSTVLVTGNLHHEKNNFFTIKKKLGGDDVPRRRWTGNCIGGVKNTPLFQFVRGFLCEYWKKHDELIDYFLIDYSILVGYNSIPQIKKIIDKMPFNSQQYYIMQDNLACGYTPELFAFLTKNTTLHKLTWKEQYPTRTANNQLTVYSYILEKYNR
jgi:hypothetical protein